MNKVIFLCMGKKGYQALYDIIETFSSDVISFIVGARDEQIKHDYYNEIVNLAKKYNIIFYDRKDNWNNEIKNAYIFAIAWRWLIKSHQKNKLIIAHDSLLPKYRGYAPLVNMLINKEEEIGVTFLFASKEYDAGNIILQKKLSINYPIKISEAIDEIAKKYSEGLIEIMKNIQTIGILESYEQEHNLATYSLWRDEEDYLINFHDSSENIRRFIDAVGYPYKGAMAYIGEELIRIVDATVYSDKIIENRDIHIGKVILLEGKLPVVVCQEGLLKLEKAVYEKNRESIFPLKKFRIRLKGLS